MTDFLVVPIHLDALWLRADLSVVDAKVDFSRLPYWDGTREVNHDIANISEELLSRPFEDRGLQLRKGVHLHWALPDALTKGNIEENGTTFPAAPNRWLVTRSRKVEEGDKVVEKIEQWIVESDYLHPHKGGARSGGIAIPFSSDSPMKGDPPYRYMGRKTRFEYWTETKEEDAAGKYLGNLGYQLTAIGYQRRPKSGRKGGGYGELTFAAFYPNCQSVFGFHDEDPPSEMRGVQYDVVGWYSHADSDDCLRAVMTAMERANASRGQSLKFDDALKEVYHWAVQDAHTPSRTVCYARLTFETGTPPSLKRPQHKHVTIAVGNTSTEALSAYLAQSVSPRLEPPSESKIMEEQLEALHLSARLGTRKLDIGPKFQEARHERGFTAVSGGTKWTIRQTSDGNGSDTAEEAPQEFLPEELAHLLNTLNDVQAECDRVGYELESMQSQLFSDWYKYMLCAYPPDDARDDYPDLDEVRYFIEKNDLLPIKRQKSKREALKSRLRRVFNETAVKIEKLKELTKKPFALQPLPAPRYWRPNEPVLLIVDDEIAATKRHGHDGPLHSKRLLHCHVQRVDATELKPQLSELRACIAKSTPSAKGDFVGEHSWIGQPWHPFILEWKVELFPLRDDKSNLSPKYRDYHEKFITENYRLEEGAVDLALKRRKVAVKTSASVFTGSSLLTPHAKFQLQKELKNYLDEKLSTTSPAGGPSEDLLRALSTVRDELAHKKFNTLAQSLSGFNDALMMHRQTLQLPIADPLGSAEAQAFTRAVHTAVEQVNRNAPQPKNDFHPIRAGVLKIHALRVVDTFGRTQNLRLKDKKVIVAESMSVRGNPHLLFLPPRLAQPARLNFTWLAAENPNRSSDAKPEMNAYPTTTAVCGWLLPNHLDNSLMVYDNSGQVLGSISAQQREWIPAPGTVHMPNKRWNVHLRKLVEHLLAVAHAQGPSRSFLGNLFDAMEAALERIDPENYTQHEALALLLGRPIAIVRAVVNLELRGRPAINQDWNVFRTDIERDLQAEDQQRNTPAQRDVDAFGKVRFPIRLGDDRQLNDGLVGYWKEHWSADGETYTYTDDCFYVHGCETARVKPGAAQYPGLNRKKRLHALLTQEGAIVTKHDFLRARDGEALWNLLCQEKLLEPLERNPNIRYAADSPDLAQAVDDPPQRLTMLVDPRGAVHATCGILPTKALVIPPEHYADALKNLSVTFLVGPILSGAGEKTTLPVPTQPGQEWSWIDMKSEFRVESTSVGPTTREATFAEAQTIKEGWLKLTKTKEPL